MKYSFKVYKDEFLGLVQDPDTGVCALKVNEIRENQETQDIDTESYSRNTPVKIVYPPRFRGSGVHKGPIVCPACGTEEWKTKSRQIQCTLSLPCVPADQLKDCVGDCEGKKFPCNECSDGPKPNTQPPGIIANRLIQELDKYCDLAAQQLSDNLNLPVVNIRLETKRVRIRLEGSATITFYDKDGKIIAAPSRKITGLGNTEETINSVPVKPIILDAQTDYPPNPSARPGRGGPNGVLNNKNGVPIVWENPGASGPSNKLSLNCPKMKNISWLYGFDNFAPQTRWDGRQQFITFNVRQPLAIKDFLPSGDTTLADLERKCNQTTSLNNYPPQFVDIPIPPGATPDVIDALKKNAGGGPKPLASYCGSVEAKKAEIEAKIATAISDYNTKLNQFLANPNTPPNTCAKTITVPLPNIEITYAN